MLTEDAGGAPFPPAPLRCRHCQLLVGPGRARTEPHDDHRGRGSAAGIYASAARASGGAEGVTEDSVLDAIAQVAGKQDCPVERLLMLDYQRHAERRKELPPLGAVLAAFGSWKAARRRAAERAARQRA